LYIIRLWVGHVGSFAYQPNYNGFAAIKPDFAGDEGSRLGFRLDSYLRLLYHSTQAGGVWRNFQ
jgi:hypothetical protein